MQYEIISLKEHPDMMQSMAHWFHEKWGVPLEAYLSSMEECLVSKQAYPAWYAACAEGRIIAGLGVIENDFHSRKDLAPNVCAVYTEKEYRNRGLAGRLLEYVCADMHEKGIDTLYLVTDHTGFYERYGWEYLCDVQSDDGISRMYIHNYRTGTLKERNPI